MKRILTFMTLFSLLLTTCEVAPGPPGLDGQNGSIISSSAFEIQVDFNANNQYQIVAPYGFEVLDYDLTLVYILWETNDGQDVWRLLPQSTTFVGGTTLTYNYDFTQTDVKIFLGGTANFSNLDAVWTQDAVCRIVVITDDNVSSVDTSNLNTIMALGNIETFEVR